MMRAINTIRLLQQPWHHEKAGRQMKCNTKTPKLSRNNARCRKLWRINPVGETTSPDSRLCCGVCGTNTRTSTMHSSDSAAVDQNTAGKPP